MLKIDERFNIEKSKEDCQLMRLDVFNLDIELIDNIKMIIYNKDVTLPLECFKFYLEEGTLKCFFLVDNKIEKGNYKYMIKATLKENCSVNILSERGFIVYD